MPHILKFTDKYKALDFLAKHIGADFEYKGCFFVVVWHKQKPIKEVSDAKRQ